MAKTYVPNRKIVSAAVSGLVTLLVFLFLGKDADPTLASGVTGAVMAVIGYLVPLPEETEDDEVKGQHAA